MRADRHTYLIAYDIPDDRRRTRLAHTLQGHGDRIQYSVFLIECAPARLVKIREAVLKVIDRDDDSVIICDIGLSKNTTATIETLGRERPITPSEFVIA